jgi:hypothetical protein
MKTNFKAEKESIEQKASDGTVTKTVLFNGGEPISPREYVFQQIRLLLACGIKIPSFRLVEKTEVNVNEDGTKVMRPRQERLVIKCGANGCFGRAFIV